MSLYALPGALFPPIDSQEFSSVRRFQSTSDCASKSESKTSCLSSTLSSSPAVSRPCSSKGADRNAGFTGRPLHVPSPYVVSPTGPLSCSPPGKGGFDEPMTSINVRGSDVVMEVRDAHIDVTKLSRSLTVVSSNAQGRGSDLYFPHQDAVYFEIFISFNGRRYTACRGMKEVVQLRDNLIEEERRLRKLSERKRGHPFRGRGQKDVPLDELSDDDTEETIDSWLSECEDVVVPELPRLSDDTLGARGFTQLNPILRSYKPALENWLAEVAEVVPGDSPVLAQFLWEPLLQAPSKPERESSGRTSSSSASTLGSIMENDCDETDFDCSF